MMVYLDYAATTPVDPRVAEKMLQYLMPDGQFGNPGCSVMHLDKRQKQWNMRANKLQI